MNGIKRWYRRLPRFTRSWFGATITVSLLVNILQIDPQLLILDGHMVTQFQVWRFFTAALYYHYPWSLSFLFNCFLLLGFSKRLERGPQYRGVPADYCFLLILTWLGCAFLSLCLNVQLLMKPMIHSVTYIWCLLNPDEMVPFLGAQFRAKHLPFAFCASTLFFNDLQLGALLPQMVGTIVGELYYYFRFEYHRSFGGLPFIQTPQFLINLIDNGNQLG